MKFFVGTAEASASILELSVVRTREGATSACTSKTQAQAKENSHCSLFACLSDCLCTGERTYDDEDGKSTAVVQPASPTLHTFKSTYVCVWANHRV